MLTKNFKISSLKSVVGLGITATIGYGTLYYSFAIMSNEIQNEFEWSRSFIFAIFSMGILLGGLLAPKVGKLLDKHGARAIMSIGSFLCFIGLFGISFISNQYEYIIAIIFLEVVSTLVLYEAAFVALSQLKGENSRVSITQITLIAGFASTIFWPLIGYLLSIIDWRGTYQVLSLFHILIAMPIHFFLLKKDLLIESENSQGKISYEDVKIKNKNSKKIFVMLAFIFSLIAIPVTVMQTHFIGLLNQFGIETAVAIGIGALIGPSQVAARVIEMIFTKKISPVTSGIFTIVVMCMALFILLFSGYSIYVAIVFVILYGAGQGLTDIIKGTIPLYIFGWKNYGTLSGKLNFYRIIVTALVPFGFALLLDNLGAKISTIFLVVISFIAIILLVLLKNELQKKEYLL